MPTSVIRSLTRVLACCAFRIMWDKSGFMRLGFFFFQAEDGIRDLIVTGVQTCALPISPTTQDTVTMEKIVALCKRRGFVFPSSEIYGGVGSTYDFGHYGVLLKANVKSEW